ncbi:MAG: flagellar biosynthesis protein FlhF, partial [Pseudomonadota bacterium]|nr:flagellar biosynthesis protein FlhF [Pseudomonadota bacterium]
MKVKRFFAPDMRQAIRLVREAQGPDAVILSNRKVDGGIEIIAALDYDESLLNDGASRTVSQPSLENATPLAKAVQEPVSAPQQVKWSQDPSIVAMRDEIKQLRGLLENQLAHLAWGDLNRREPLHAGVMRRFSSMELDTALIERVSAPTVHARDEEHAWQLALSELAGSVPVAEQDVMDQGGIVALVGSTG